MKKADPIQLIILIIALLFGYNALNIIPFFLWAFYHWLAEGLIMDGTFSRMGLNLLYFIFYTAVAVLLVKRSKLLAAKINGTAEFFSGAALELKRNDILYVSMIILGAYLLATKLPKLFVKLYTIIKDSNQHFISEGPNYIMPGETIGEMLFTCVTGMVLLAYPKTLTEYITRHVKDEEDDIETIGIDYSKQKEK
jgi:hypothetical protein